jgi:ribonuclease BN (tRNA processing enzyme)
MTSRLLGLLLLAVVLSVGWVAAFVIYRAAEVGELVSPLETRRFERLTVIAVGTGGPYENPERLGPASALAWEENVWLVDAGRGLAEALRKAQIRVSQPQVVLLTNLLPLNTVGLDDLLLTGWLRERTQPLRVLGPPGTEELVEGLLRAHARGAAALGRALALPAGGDRIEVSEIGDGWSEEVDGVVVSAAALDGGPLPALAYRFERGRRSVVVSGTGWGEDALVRFATGANMLVHEAVYIPATEDLEDAGVVADPQRLEREAALHTALSEVGKLAQRAGVDSLVLVRLRPPPFFRLQVTSMVANDFDGSVLVPEDGAELQP